MHYRRHPNSFKRGNDQSGAFFKSQLLKEPDEIAEAHGVLVYSGNLYVRRLFDPVIAEPV